MKVTLRHPKSKHGYPVILDDDGSVMEIAAGIEKALAKIGISHPKFAAYCDILPTTLHQYGRRADPPANVLNMLGILLEDPDCALNHVTKEALKLSEIESCVLSMLREGLTYLQVAKKLQITRQRAYQIAQTAAGKKVR